MDNQQFSAIQQKHLVKTIDAAWAYVPPPLPPEIDMGAIAMSLATASEAVGKLDGAARRLQNPYLLVQALIRKEALTSSAMEGTITTLGNIVLEDADPNANADDNAREAFNYAFALREANKQLQTLPISHRVIKHAHENLLANLSSARGSGKRPGQYKVHQNAVGQLGETVRSARYVPPPPAQTLTCMDALETFINREDRLAGERLIDLAISHYQFEAIHPFDDGNGRIGRMLVTLMSQQMKLVDLPLLHISSFMEKNKTRYIDQLFEVSTQSNWTSWIIFFLSAVEVSCVSAIHTVDRLIELQKNLKDQVLQAKGNHRLATIVDNLFQDGWTNIGKTQKLCSVTFPTAQSDLKTLTQLGILREFTDRRPTIYFAPAIINLSERE